MQSRLFNAIFLIAACALSTGARAEKTYKCGNNYSQTPCPGGIAIDTNDSRSLLQKQQTDLATSRDAKAAHAMETARLKQEKADLATNTPQVHPESANSGTAKAASRTGSTLHARKKEPKPFTALVPGDKKTSAAVKKKTKKKAGQA
ncbi:MAG: hypothetical protein V4713_14695 [Pseudomonadota bacterium]